MAISLPLSPPEKLEESKICTLCLTQFAKYSCPKCNVKYCSLACYQSEKHVECSETFYRDNIIQEIQQRQVSDADKAKVLSMLRRLEEGDESLADVYGEAERGGVSATEGTPALEERLRGLDLDKDEDEVWKQLTPAERKDFHRMAREGALSRLLYPAAAPAPWWEVASRPVVPVEEEEAALSCGEETSRLPPLPAKLPSLADLTKGGKVSPLLCYNVVNVLYAYTYTVRLYSTSHHDLPLQASQTLFEISSCLSENSCFDSVGLALQTALAAVKKNRDVFNSDSFSVAVVKDVGSILVSPGSQRCSFVPRALADVHKLFGSARSHARQKKDRKFDAAGQELASVQQSATIEGSGATSERMGSTAVKGSCPDNSSSCDAQRTKRSLVEELN